MFYLKRHGLAENNNKHIPNDDKSLTLRFMPLPNATRWNFWLKFAYYVSDYLEYIRGFYLEEKQYEKNKSVETINNIFENSNNNSLVEIYLIFLKSYGFEFTNQLDFFQKESKPVFPLIEGRIEQLELFLSNNITNIMIENLLLMLFKNLIRILLFLMRFFKHLLKLQNKNLMIIFYIILHVPFLKHFVFLILVFLNYQLIIVIFLNMQNKFLN